MGVSYIARAWLDIKHRAAMAAGTVAAATKTLIVDFEADQAQEEWDMLGCGPMDPREAGPGNMDRANCLISEDGKRLIFLGAHICPCAAARGGAQLHPIFLSPSLCISRERKMRGGCACPHQQASAPL